MFRLDALMLRHRVIADELMDADDVEPATYAAVLADLAAVNTLTFARRPTLNFLDRVIARDPRPLRILDVGYGDGDMLRAVARWAVRRDVAVDLVGIDLNPRSAPAAAATATALPIDYRTGDYAALVDEPWDVVVSSLVAHHMTPDQLIAFVRFMDRTSRRGWFVNDLRRSIVAQSAFRLLAAVMRWHPIVRHDGALSVARSYRPDEWPAILAAADLRAATPAAIGTARVTRIFPFRLCVECIR